MPRGKSKATLEDIAAHAGVSIATVSRVINGADSVRKELEERVKQAMEELGFQPKQRQKIRTKPPVILLIVPDFLNPAIDEMFAGIQDEVNKIGSHLLVLPVPDNAEFPQDNLRLLKQISFDAIILSHLYLTPKNILSLCNRGATLPIVTFNDSEPSPQVYRIDTDRESGMYQATKYLLSLNHREIAYLSGPSEWNLSTVRLQGIQRALSEAGFSLKPHFHCSCFPTIENGFQVTSSLLQRPHEEHPTALLAFNDLIAIGAIHAIRTFGLSVPEDISVIGFDNNFLTLHTNPPLTTVAQPKYQIGQLAVQKIANHLKGDNTEKGGFMFLECPLIVRESTAPCKT